MRTITRLYNRLKDRAKAEKSGFLCPYEENGIQGYKASVGTLTGGSVWKGGTFTHEERFFEDRQTALDWIEASGAEEGKVFEITFSNNPQDYTTEKQDGGGTPCEA